MSEAEHRSSLLRAASTLPRDAVLVKISRRDLASSADEAANLAHGAHPCPLEGEAVSANAQVNRRCDGAYTSACKPSTRRSASRDANCRFNSGQPCSRECDDGRSCQPTLAEVFMAIAGTRAITRKATQRDRSMHGRPAGQPCGRGARQKPVARVTVTDSRKGSIALGRARGEVS